MTRQPQPQTAKAASRPKPATPSAEAVPPPKDLTGPKGDPAEGKRQP
jgi:hypothetical protein